MPNIKIKQKENTKMPIKKVDRKSIYTKKLKENIIDIKERKNTREDEEK